MRVTTAFIAENCGLVTVFLDYSSAVAGSRWGDELADRHMKMAFCGGWIDVSKASSINIGSYRSGDVTMNPVNRVFGLPRGLGTVIILYTKGFKMTNVIQAASVSAMFASQALAYLITSPAGGFVSCLRFRPPQECETGTTLHMSSTSYKMILPCMLCPQMQPVQTVHKKMMLTLH